MANIGYTLTSEEHGPNDLVRNAQRAEDAGFKFLMISDHSHPWIDAQGHSPFAWTVLGALAQVTGLPLGTAVTCPTMRYHPAPAAQMAATVQVMANGNFLFGVGTGENLNEHVYGDHWPPYDLRSDMLVEAIEIMRELWTGDLITYYGDFYTVEEARLYTLPDSPPPVLIAAGGPQSAALAGQIGDGLISTSPQAELVQTFRENGGAGKPTYGQLTVAYAGTDDEALEIAYKYWPTAAVPGQLGQELRSPALFEDAIKRVTRQDVAEAFTVSSDLEKHQQAIQAYLDAGFDHVYVHAVGPEQEKMLKFYESQILPAFR